MDTFNIGNFFAKTGAEIGKDAVKKISTTVATNVAQQWTKTHCPPDAIRRYCSSKKLSPADKKSLENQLKKWTKSTEFESYLEKLFADPTLADDEAIDSFINATQLRHSVAGLPTRTTIAEFNVYLLTLYRMSDPFFDTFAKVSHEKKLERQLFASIPINLKASANLIEITPGTVQYPPSLIIPEAEVRSAEELGLHAEVDGAIKCLQAYRAHEAKTRLLSTLEKADELATCSQYLKYRIHSSLGCALIQLGEFSAAKAKFKLALDLKKSSMAFNNCANAYLLNNDFSDALRYSNLANTASEKSSEIALAIRLQILFKNGLANEVETLLQEHPVLSLSPAGIMAQGQIAFDTGNYLLAASLFGQAAANNSVDPQLPMLQAQSLIKEFQRWENAQSFDREDPSEEHRSSLERILTLLGTALKLLPIDDGVQLRVLCLIYRASALTMLNRFAEAEVDCIKVLELDSQNQGALYQRAAIEISARKNYRGALNFIHQLSTTNQSNAALLSVECYRELGELALAQQALQELEVFTQARKMEGLYALEALHIGFAQGTGEAAIKALLEKHPRNGDVFYAISQSLYEQKRFAESLAFLRRAETSPNLSLAIVFERERAMRYFGMRYFNAAASEYKKIVDFEVNSSDLYNYIISLRNAGSLPAIVASLARRVRERNNGAPVQGISEIEMAFQMGMGRMENIEYLDGLTKYSA